MFTQFADLLHSHFSELSKGELYRTEAEGDKLWETYLAAFPEGTNPFFRKRTEHDGSYDRSVIRRIGNVVAIKGGTLVSIWDIPNLPYPYDVVAKALSAYAKGFPIDTVFRMGQNEKTLGYKSTTEKMEDHIHTWHHFYVNIAARHRTHSVGEETGAMKTRFQTYKRAVTEISTGSAEIVLDLIADNNLYRGTEFKGAIENFLKAQRNVKGDLDIWEDINNSVAGFRNTAIGSLLVAISDGEAVDDAVRKFESMMAPQNYKRPKAIVTQAQIDQAVKTIEELGLEGALYRRHATLSDVSINNVIWASGEAEAVMTGVRSLLETTNVGAKKGQEVNIHDFIRSVLPGSKSLEVEVKTAHVNRLMNITTGDQGLFKWDNPFAWSYNGDITDSVKERIKAAGGNINADIRVSLSWYNLDDLDLHADTPYGDIGFHSKKGILDVDMNSPGSIHVRDAVENMAFNNPRDGDYSFYVNNYQQRETSNVGFQVDVIGGGVNHQLSYPLRVKGNVNVCRFTVKDGMITNFAVTNKDIRWGGRSEDVWGITTENYIPVTTLMTSPNYWDGQSVGNQHWFFLLKGCKNPSEVRGLYNEFLRGDLEQHRRVFEVLGSKTKCAYSDNQLAGIGFSSTQEAKLNVRVDGRPYTITF